MSAWYISDNVTLNFMDEKEDTAIRMMQVNRTLGIDALKVNSTQGYADLDITFRIHKFLRSTIEPWKWYNPNYASVKVRYSSLEERLTNFWVIKNETHS
jgi:hypothetical protein